MSRLQKSLVLVLIALLLFSLCRALLYLFYPDEFDHLTLGHSLMAFANGLRFDGAVIARLFAIPLILMNLPLRFFDRRWWFDPFAWLLYLLTLGLVLLLLADVIYFQYVKRHIAYELLLLKDDVGFLLDYAKQGFLLELGGFVLFAAGLFLLWRRILAGALVPVSLYSLKFVALFLALVIVGRGGVSGKVIEIIDAYGTGDSGYGHLSLNGAFTTIVFALNLDEANHSFFPEKEAIDILARHREVADRSYPMVMRYPGKPTGYNVVFILLESWNFQFVDSFGGNGYGATPVFDSLAAEGMIFNRFYAAGQRSIEGIQATLTGVPALKGLPRFDAGIGVSNVSRLGVIARNHGYRTLFVQSSDRDSFKIQGIASATGFEEFYGREDIPLLYDYPDPEAATFGWDYDTLMFLKQRIDTLQEPFFTYLFTGTTHQPYADIDEQFRLRKHEPFGEGGYINTLAYADWSIGQFMQAARNTPWFDNTIFIFTADHTSSLQEGGFLQRFHTPFLIYAPKIIKPAVNSTVGSQLDVMPTIIDLLGFDEEFSALGESLFRKQEASAFTTMGASAIGLITENAYLKHSLSNRLEAVSLSSQSLPNDYFDRIERLLLAQDQLSYELLKENRWAR
jgi:phosphoglycerol transferase MdoB-like AlkP superfamily enzyme